MPFVFFTSPCSRISAFTLGFEESKIKPAHMKQNSHLRPFLDVQRKRLSNLRRRILFLRHYVVLFMF